MIPRVENIVGIQPYLNRVKSVGEFLTAYEMGGIDVQDPSQGLLVQLWTLTCDGERIYLQSPTRPKFLLLEDVNITEVDLAFDQSMFPFVCYVTNGVVKFYWFDTELNQYIVSILSQIAVSPRCTLDDKRPFNLINSDVVMMYIDPAVGLLCCRVQRERYEVLHILEEQDPAMRVQCLNMAEGFRLQWQLNDVLAKPPEMRTYKALHNFTRPISVTGEYRT